MKNRESIASLAQKEVFSFDDLCELVRVLRSEDGCSWDREQNHHTVRSSLIEETYEVVEAIDSEDMILMREELGDLLFQVLFHAQMEAEAGSFSMDDVIGDICKKMIHRHPHVFATQMNPSPEQVLTNWEAIKIQEKKRDSLSKRLRAIPPMLPALMRASKVQRKVESIEALSKEKLCQQLQDHISALSQSEVTEEAMGELLMKVTSLALVNDIDAECALSHATNRYIEQVEQAEKAFH